MSAFDGESDTKVNGRSERNRHISSEIAGRQNKPAASDSWLHLSLSLFLFFCLSTVFHHRHYFRYAFLHCTFHLWIFHFDSLVAVFALMILSFCHMHTKTLHIFCVARSPFSSSIYQKHNSYENLPFFYTIQWMSYDVHQTNWIFHCIENQTDQIIMHND